MMRRYFIVWITIVSLIGNKLTAQEAVIFTIKDALKLAESNYPSISAKRFSVEAGRSNITLQKQDLLPRLDLNLQALYSTVNNIYGLSYPQDIVLPISGPVKAGNSYRPLWGSAAGLLVSWQPFTFGERKARIELANSELKAASNDLANEIFNHDVLVIDTWLNYLAARAIISAQSANISRTLSLYQSIKVLTGKGLKPGVDSMIVAGEVSRARVGLNNARQSMALFKLQIAEQLALPDTSFAIPDQNFLSDRPLLATSGKDSLNNNPVLLYYQSQIEAANTRLTLSKHSFHPRLSFFESSFTRGSGADINGNNDYSLSGLSFSKYNYAFGAMLTFPLFQYFPNRTQIQIQHSNLMRQKSLYDEQELKIRTEQNTAVVRIQTALQNYDESQIRFRAASASFNQMKVRYNSGLVTLPELFQIQYELNLAEAESSIAVLSVWRACLYYAQATGNINLFLNQVK